MKKLLKILGIALGGVVCLVAVLLGGMNIAKFAIYKEYYSIESRICKNPGLSDDFVCQGVCVSEENGVAMVCGYMSDKSNSRIYVVDLESDRSYYVTLTTNGEKYTGHAGGMATTGNVVYIANASKLFLVDLQEILSAKNGDTVDIGSGVAVNNAASYVYCDEKYIYVGEFHHTEGNYEKFHDYESSEGMHHAIVSRYTHDAIQNRDLSLENYTPAPDKIYSIRAKVQGVCFTPDGKVVLSTSYGVADSVYYVYNESDARNSGETLDGAPVFVLEDCIKSFNGPAMSEDMDYYDGKVITLSESASNKYIFGKFFFANDVIGLEI